MDPLSVAASIIGILTATTKVAEIVFALISDAKAASDLADTIYFQALHVKSVLAPLKSMLEDLATPATQASASASYVPIDHLVVLFTDGVLLFSRLEGLLQPFKPLDVGNAQFGLR